MRALSASELLDLWERGASRGPIGRALEMLAAADPGIEAPQLVSIGRRGTTTTAPQALSFLNGDLARRCAYGFADRLAIETDLSLIAIHGYRIAFGRDPTDAETQLATSFIATQRSAYLSAGRPEQSRAALVDLCQALMQMSEFIYIP